MTTPTDSSAAGASGTSDVVILGAGLTGMAAAIQLGNQATVLEAGARPGGLVASVRVGAWWFDHVLHLLYFRDPETERIVRTLLGPHLAECPPKAFVETPRGTARYPLQMHLSTLPKDLVVRCLADLARRTFSQSDYASPSDFRDYLLRTFGEGLCEAFMFPYNEKMWKRPLESLAPNGFQWNITHPDYEQVLRGALGSEEFPGYNSSGHYPRPPTTSRLRTMEVLAQRLAAEVKDLRTQTVVCEIHAARGIVRTISPQGEQALRWSQACLSTIPLPTLLRICVDAPVELRQGTAELASNCVRMVYLCLRGPRPKEFGHWRYYGSPDVIFNRLVSMTDFDPLCAPADGWGLMAEITARSEESGISDANLIDRVLADARRVGAVTCNHTIEAVDTRRIDPAYVVFTPGSRTVAAEARQWLRDRRIYTLGRYGRWEYSSMAQCMRDGFRWGRATAAVLGQSTTSDLTWREGTGEADRA